MEDDIRTASDSAYDAIERRIEMFLVGVGAVVVVGAELGWGFRAAAAAGAGAALCWLNARWLRAGAAAVVQLGVVQAGAAKLNVPKGVQVKFVGRLLLLLAATYVILTWLRLPAVPFVCGLTAIVPAIMLELGYELVHGQHRWTHSKSDS